MAGFLALLISAGAWMLPSSGTRAAEIDERRGLAYQSGPDAHPAQRLDLYLPVDALDAPTLVWFPGGDWRRVDRLGFAGTARALAAQGLAVAVIGYRSAGVQHPEHARDVARGLAFARNRLLLDGRDPDTLFLGGQDAGAHLATLLALNGRFLAEHGLGPEDLRGIIGLSGTYRVDPAGQSRSEVFGLDPLQRLDASPLHQVVPGAPPMRLFHASSDLPGRAEEAQDLARQLSAAGIQHRVIEVADRSFSSLIGEMGSPEDPTTESILAFVARYRSDAPTARPTPSPAPTDSPSPTPRGERPEPPDPPSSGPGSEAGLPYGSARVERVERGNLAWWQLLPDGEVLGLPGEDPGLRLLVFVPASGPQDPSRPDAYRAWLEHLARAGYLVLLPDYAAPGLPPADWSLRLRRILRALPEALSEREAGPLRIDPEGTAWVGHGDGAVLALNAAAHWFEDGLPAPRAILAAMPRDPAGLLESVALHRLPVDLRYLQLAGDADPGRDEALEIEIWRRLGRLPMDWRDRLLLQSDDHGRPALVADFGTAYTSGPTGRLDAHDHRAGWKWLDALLRCSEAGQLCPHALGGGPEQLGLGAWSDGQALRPALRLRRPSGPADRLWLPYLLRRP